MQGFFNESALDFETAAGERLPVISNAAERRDADGALLFTALVVTKATDRRRYERQLVDSRSELQIGLATERESRNCASNL
jgi:sigma-B regulation protein RsbU (phosphoserine phosphatase)